MDQLLRGDIAAALAEIRGVVAEDVRALFDRGIDPDRLPASAAYHLGFIAGVAQALDLTVIELLDDLDLDLDSG